MTEEFKNAIRDFPYIDFDDFFGFSIDLVKVTTEDGEEYNPQISFVALSETPTMQTLDKDFQKVSGGIIMRTGIIEPSIELVAEKVKLLIESYTFSHLTFISNCTIYDLNGEEESDISWDDYIRIGEVE